MTSRTREPARHADATVGVAVDVVPYAVRDGRLQVGLVRVESGPARGRFAFPGGRVRQSESLDAAAERWLSTALPGHGAHLEQLYTFGEPGRDPAARVVSVGYLALLARPVEARGCFWTDADALPSLAYDHDTIAEVARERLRAKLGYTNLAWALLEPTFTLAEMQQAYESVLGRKLDRRNFRKRALALGLLSRVDAARRGPHRPAQLYRFSTREPLVIGHLG